MSITARSMAVALLTLLLSAGALHAQSGRGMMRGYVEFEGVAYNDVASSKTVAAIEMRSTTSGNGARLTGRTDDHGLFEIASVPMGEYTLRISAPGYRPYTTRLSIPSDFVGNIAVRLRRVSARRR